MTRAERAKLKARALAGRLFDAAADRIEGQLACVVSTPVGEYEVSGREALTEMLNSPDATRKIVACNLDALREVSGRRTFHGIVRWVDAVRPVLLEDKAREGNGIDFVSPQVVAAGRMVVREGGVVERELCTSERRRAPLMMRLPRVVRARARGHRRRSATRRSRSGSPAREPGEPPEPPSRGRSDGLRAAA